VSESTDAPNRLEFQQFDPDEDQLPFAITSADKATGLAIWPYGKWLEKARALSPSGVADDLPQGLRLAAVAEKIEADALATDRPPVRSLSLTSKYS
jgi:hypothetical protein